MVNMCSGSSSVGANEAQRNTVLADMTLAEFRRAVVHQHDLFPWRHS